MYERGQGVAKDLGRARSWYQAAAEKGNVKAMHNLAVSLSGRESGTADYEGAAKWYEQAASYGLADSLYNLGILAEHGLGIPKDLSRAYTWFTLAAKAGDAEAAKRSEQITQARPSRRLRGRQAGGRLERPIGFARGQRGAGVRRVGRRRPRQQCFPRQPRTSFAQPARL